MKNKSKKGNTISRRKILPLLGGSLFVPFLGVPNSIEEPQSTPNNEEYQTLLKPDGTSVKVKVSTVNKSRLVQKNLSNSSFLNWLGKKD